MAEEILKIKKSTLKSMADHVRTKGGTTAPLQIPDGFNAAVDAIKTGKSVAPYSKIVVKEAQANLDGSIIPSFADMQNLQTAVFVKFNQSSGAWCIYTAVIDFTAQQSGNIAGACIKGNNVVERIQYDYDDMGNEAFFSRDASFEGKYTAILCYK